MSHNFFPRFPPWPCAGVGGVKGKKQTAASATRVWWVRWVTSPVTGPAHWLTAPRVSSGCGVQCGAALDTWYRSVTSHINTRYRQCSQVTGALSWYLLSTSWGVHCTLYPSPSTLAMQGPSLARQCSRDNAGPHAGSRHTHLQFLLLITVTYFAFIYTFILWWRLNKDFQQFLSLQYEYFIPLFMIFRACLDNCIETILCLPGAWPSLLLVPVFPCLITDTGRWSGLFNLLLLQNTMVRVVT